MRMVIEHETTEMRRIAFSGYCDERVASHKRGLVCPHADPCTQSVPEADYFAGQMGHVGHHYDLQIDGAPLRILIVGQEYGRDPNSIPIQGRDTSTSIVTVEERYRDLVGFRGSQSFDALNPHMRGTSMAMRTVLDVALGEPDPGSDPTRHNEPLVDQQGDTFHLFDAMAFTNLLLCSATASRARRSVSHPRP